MLAKTCSSPAEARTVPGGPPHQAALGLLVRPGLYHSVKRGVDFILALVMCVPALPLILLSAIAVKLTSRGPAFYSQIRVGRDGRPFRLYKLRSMVEDSEKNGACWCKPGDPRVTRVGRFLRKTHLDELPQLWNVLCGDMSLVGPRPERPEFVPSLEQAIPRYRDRLQVRPGLTGVAQVQLPPDTDLESVRRKLACDLFYIRQMSFWLDVRLIVVTSFYLLGRSCLWPCRFFRIPGGPAIEAHYAALVRERDPAPTPPAPAPSSPPSPAPELAPLCIETQTA